MSPAGDERVSFSLVVPAFNEAARIAGPLRAMGAYMAARHADGEIVVVDDGSADGTLDVVLEEAAGLGVPVRVLRYERNRGKGYAIKVGVAASRGERVLFTDADLSTPIEEAARLLAGIDEGYDLVIGSRKTAGSEIRVHQPWLRERLGKVFTLIVRVLISNVSDVTCGFKAFRGDVARDLFSRVRVYDWSFDAEILLLARRRGARLLEVPVCWEDRAGTKVSLARDILNSLIGLARIRWNAATGRYASPEVVPLPRERTAGGPLRDPGRVAGESA